VDGAFHAQRASEKQTAVTFHGAVDDENTRFGEQRRGVAAQKDARSKGTELVIEALREGSHAPKD